MVDFESSLVINFLLYIESLRVSAVMGIAIVVYRDYHLLKKSIWCTTSSCKRHEPSMIKTPQGGKSPRGCFALSLINGLHHSAEGLGSHCHVAQAGKA